MAHDHDLPSPKELATELIQLRHRQSEMLRQYEKVLDRIAAFPNEWNKQELQPWQGRSRRAHESNTSKHSLYRLAATTDNNRNADGASYKRS
jgi:hypothetical protein